MTPHKKRSYVRRNRPDQAGLLVGVRLQPPELADLDAWRASRPGDMSRPEAMRAIMALALSRAAENQGFAVADGEMLSELSDANAEAYGDAWGDNDDVFIVEPDDAALSILLSPPPPPSPAPARKPDLLGPLGPIWRSARS
jgi:hypothetical protein